MKLKFKWIGAGCFTIEINDQIKLACDPCLSSKGTQYDFRFFKSERVKDPVFQTADFSNVDCWLLTHKHDDHLDKKGISFMQNDSKKLVQKDVSRWLANEGIKNIDTMAWGDDTSIKKDGIQVQIQAIPAIHGSNMLSAWFAGNVNGYWLTIKNNAERNSVYITGDTICSKKVEKFIGNKMCDVLIPNMGEVMKDRFGGPLTLDNEMLDHMIDCLEPKVVLPIHYGCFSHYSPSFPEVNIYHKSLVRKTELGEPIELTI